MTHALDADPPQRNSGEQVAQTVGEQTRRVAAETGKQAKDLLREGRQQLAEQAREGQQRAARGLRALADQLDQMHAKADGPGMLPDIVRQTADQTRQAASWLDRREPGDLVNEVRAFARRRPGLFLAGAALAGVLVGRLTRGVVDAQGEDDKPDKPDDKQQPAPRTVRPPQPPPPSFQAMNPAVAPPGYPPQVQPGYAVPPAPAYSQPPPQVPPNQQPPAPVPPNQPPAQVAPNQRPPVPVPPNPQLPPPWQPDLDQAQP
jgi:hypothetical protein